MKAAALLDAMGLGAGVSNARGAGTDPVSAVACGQVVAGISRRGAKDTPLAKSCSRNIRAQGSSE